MRRYIYTVSFMIFTLIGVMALSLTMDCIPNGIWASVAWLCIGASIISVSVIDYLDHKIMGKIIDIICCVCGMDIIYVSIRHLIHTLIG